MALVEVVWARRIYICYSIKNKETHTDTFVQKHKILISTKVSAKSKTTETIKKYTKVEVKTQTNTALSTPIEFNTPRIQSQLSTASDSTKPEIQWAVKAIKSHEVEVEKDLPTCKITGVHCCK